MQHRSPSAAAGRVMVFETGRDVQEAAERALDSAASAVSECLRHQGILRRPLAGDAAQSLSLSDKMPTHGPRRGLNS